jgi:hypothetical protein
MSAHSPASTWRDPIFAHFTREIATVARLTVVADPDGLLAEEGVIDGIRERGFEIVPFEDHIAFRYAYERRFREVWDDGRDTNLVVVLRATRSDLSGLPFDLLEQAKRDRRLLSFSLAELFPSLALMSFLNLIGATSTQSLWRSSFSSLNQWARTPRGTFCCVTYSDSILLSFKTMRSCFVRSCDGTTAQRSFRSPWAIA